MLGINAIRIRKVQSGPEYDHQEILRLLNLTPIDQINDIRGRDKDIWTYYIIKDIKDFKDRDYYKEIKQESFVRVGFDIEAIISELEDK